MHSGNVSILVALVDSEVVVNLINQDRELLLKALHPLKSPRKITTIDRGPIGTGIVTHCTESNNQRHAPREHNTLCHHHSQTTSHP